MKKECGHKFRRQSGFTLIEMSIVILLLGTVIAVFATGYQSYQVKVAGEENKDRITKVADKVNEYRKIYGHYPCPSSLTSRRTSAEYGVAPPSCIGTVPVGTCDATSGLCAQSAIPARAANGDVAIGALPFRELNLPEEESYDSYGDRIVYAVTQNMTDRDKIKENGGAVSIVNEQGVDLFTPAGSGHFIVVSLGKNRVGGFNINGKNSVKCTGVGADVANCDFLTGSTEAKFQSNYYSTNSVDATDTATHFDDLVAFNQAEERALWRKGLTEQGEKSKDLIDLAEDKIIMGAQSAIGAASAQLSVLYSQDKPNFDGGLYIRGNGVTGGNLKTKQVCDLGGTNCFEVGNLVENCDPTGTTGKYVTGIFGGHIKCDRVFFGCKDGAGNPDPRQMLLGVNPTTGAPVCGPTPLTPDPGVCGSANGSASLPTTPSGTELCNPGNVEGFSGEGTSADPFRWRCSGYNRGASSPQCRAHLLPPPYDGICGDDNNADLYSAPTRLCRQGALENNRIEGSGPWTWRCLGDGDGHRDVSCRATKTIVTPPSCTPGP